MTWRGPTYRTVGGERISGVWCHVWQRVRTDGEYFPEDLFVFADGEVRFGQWPQPSGAGGVDGLQRMLASGRITLTRPGAPDLPPGPPTWGSRRSEALTPEGFLQEVADEIEVLNGRPDSAKRCWDAIQRYHQDPTEANRGLLRDAYLAVPPHRRIYVLGDMDRQDQPLRILLTDIGTPVPGDGPMVTAEMHQDVLEYFRRGDRGAAQATEQRAVRHADDPTGPGRPAIISHETVYPRGWPQTLDLFVLRNEYPATVHFAQERYPSVLHGYWALSAADPRDRVAIRDTASAREAHDRGGAAARRTGWAAMRPAVMAGLLRGKFTQHPELAAILLATGDAPISYTGLSDSPYWRDVPDLRGRNWMGRLLELTRAELLAQQVLANLSDR